MIVKTMLAAAAIAAIGAASASAAAWAPKAAAIKLKATYVTVDTVRRDTYRGRLKADLAAGIPESDPRIIRDRQYIADAVARPDKVVCTGVGRRAARYVKFHCTAHVIGLGTWALDGFEATKRLTVLTAHGFVVRAGWR